MSHSSLSAQLASLHSKNTTSSRQHSDAIGRGIHHSAQAGHAILNTSNTSHKPSVLHPDSRAAAIADVPFTTLRDNAVISLQYLSQKCSPLFEMSAMTTTVGDGNNNLPWQTLFGSNSIKYERGLNTPETNDRIDGLIKEALFLLSTAWGDAASTIAHSSSTFVQLGSSTPSSVLHTLEYLVQKYYAHVHNADDFIVAFLPHHETFLFDRLLQLVDLAQMPQWAFLRPYSAAVGVNGVPRTVIAKWAASTKDNGGGTAVVKRVCSLAKRGGRIHALQRNLVGGDLSTTLEVRRGVSLFISFAAAILAETFHIQHSANGSIQEATLRSVLPFILSAVEPNNANSRKKKKKQNWSLGAICPEWRAFGQVMISLLVDKCELNSELCEGLSIGVLRGAKESIEIIRSADRESGVDIDGDMDMETSASVEAVLDLSSDAILSVMSLVLGNQIDGQEKDKDSFGIVSQLTMINSKDVPILGCNLSYPAFKSLMKLPHLPATLGYLSEEREIDISTLIGCVIAMTIDSCKRQKVKRKDRLQYIRVLSDMIEEESLRNVWSRPDRSMASATSATIVGLMKGSGDDVLAFDELAKVLSMIRDIDAPGCDAGVAHAVTSVASMSTESEKETAGKNIRRLLNAAGLLEIETDIKKKQKKKSKSRSANDDGSSSEPNDFDMMLPSRVALEHPNAELRKESIIKLIKEAENGDAHDIATAFLRRYVADNDASVICASADALLTMASNDSLSDSFFLQNSVVNAVLEGLQKQTSESSSDASESTICSSLRLAGHVTKIIRQDLFMDENDVFEGNDNLHDVQESYKYLVQELVQFRSSFDSKTSNVAEEVKKATDKALHCSLHDVEMPKTNPAFLKKTITSNCFHWVLQQSILDKDAGEKSAGASMPFVWFFLHHAADLSAKDYGDRSLIDSILDSADMILRKHQVEVENKKKFSSEANTLVKCLTACTKKLLSGDSVHKIVRLVYTLSTVESEVVYREISLKIFEAMSKKSAGVYPYVLVEVVSQQSLPIVGIERLLEMIKGVISTSKSKALDAIFRCLFVTGIMLCGHAELTIRKSALGLISWMNDVSTVSKATSMAVSCIYETACSESSSMQSSIMMDGPSAMSQMLSKAVRANDNGSNLSSVLLTSCAEMITDHLLGNENEFAGEGVSNTVAILLSAMESAGESSFPLSLRWSSAGKPIFARLVDWPFPRSDSTQQMVECVLVMLKGVKVDKVSMDEGVVITTGPSSSGGRRRAYSIGMSDCISHIDPYPDDMKEAITSLLSMTIKNSDDSFSSGLFETLVRVVIGRTSWASGVFSKIDDTSRGKIVDSLLHLRSDGNFESAGLAMLGLPIRAHEFASALSSKSSRVNKEGAGGLLALTTLTDCVRAQSEALSVDKSVSALASSLFAKLSTLSTSTVSNDGSDYARTCIIYALLKLAETDSLLKSKNSGSTKFAKDISAHSKLLVSLLGNEGGSLKPLVSSKSKSLCLKLLTHLCAVSPTSVVDSLVPAMINAISGDVVNTNITKDALMAVVPAFCKHAHSADFTLLDLLNAFIDRFKEAHDVSWDVKLDLYICLNQALMSSQDADSVGEVVSTVISVYLASEAPGDKGSMDVDQDQTPLSFATSLLTLVNGEIQIETSLEILQYVGKLLACLQSTDEEQTADDSQFYSVGAKELLNLALRGFDPEPSANQHRLTCIWLLMSLLDVVKNIFATPIVKRAVRHSDDQQAAVCLKVWQELMVLQSSASHTRFAEAKSTIRDVFWSSIGDKVGSVLSDLQRLLPVPHFLASMTSIMNDSEIEVEIQTRAILLLAERSVETDVNSPEAALFLEMLPELFKLSSAKLPKNKKSESYRRTAALHQSSFKAIDHFVRSFGLAATDEYILRKRAKVFMPALQSVANCLQRISTKITFPDQDSDDILISCFTAETQTFTSAALCASSLVTLLNAKCLALLPKLVKPLLTILKSSNENQRQINNEKSQSDTILQSIRLIQLSTLRALVAVAERIPQFFVPYVETLLGPNVLPAACLRNSHSEEDIAVNNTAERLDHAIATQTPVRQLIPILSKATSKCLKSGSDKEEIWRESLIIFKILKLAITSSSRVDLAPLAGKIINSLVQAYSFDCKVEAMCELLSVANDTMLSMVMKLSEAQLRPLYAKLRQWRGDLDQSSSDSDSVRKRNAFWSLSAAMSKELRSIFLPCLSTVVGDIIKELEFAASCLCVASKSSRGNKRQRLLLDGDSNTYSATGPLQSLLLCLEYSLKADAHDGGNWIRNDEGERYRKILQPLGKLLIASIPQDCFIMPPLEEDSKPISAYVRLIQGVGTEDHGNVVSCLTSLAAAAGNEQLWKPLNHTLLETCGDERRSEVRKSGVKCLLSIIHTLGEEYMVLLPECLPVLSELLEDEDEDIAALAKQCVQQGEELLGESLEDSLR